MTSTLPWQFNTTVELNGGSFEIDADILGATLVKIDVYLNGIWLNDLLSERTLAYIENKLKEDLVYHLAVNDNTND